VLILTRKSGESIVVGDHIRVVVVEVKGRQVRLGVEAPDDMKIYRAEIFDRIQEENNRASQVGTADLNNAIDLWSRVRSEGASDAD
jgi:carbon storage regulator